MKFLKNLLAILLLTSCLTALGEDAPAVLDRDLAGNWTLVLSNSLTRRQVTLAVDEYKDKRLRGHLYESGQPEIDLDGKVEEGGKAVVWGRWVDRAGQSTEYQFKVIIEGEPGQETMTGKGEYWGKRYKISGARAK